MGIALSGVLLYLVVFAIAFYREGDFLTPAGLLLPFGFTAIIYQRGGGFSFNVADLYIIGIITAWVLLRSMKTKQLLVPRYALLPIAFGLFALIWAIFPPRFFAGEVATFSLSGEKGRSVGPFSSSLVTVKPTSTNISQFLYIVIFLSAYVFFRSVAARSGIHRLVKVLEYAAIANLLICLVNLFLGPEILEPFRTADYGALTNVSVAGVLRITGGFPEASRLGDFATPLGAFFITLYFMRGGTRNMILGFGTMAMALLSVSSTAFVGFAGFSLVLVQQILFSNNVRTAGRFIVIGTGLGLALFVALAVSGNIVTVNNLISNLLFNKVTSQSGLERTAWAQQGLQVFWDTYGLGAGTGSARSNGLLPVMLANLGLIGTTMFLFMIAPAFRQGRGSPVERASFVAFCTMLTVKLVSHDTLNLGMPFALYLALAVQSRFPERHPAPPPMRTQSPGGPPPGPGPESPAAGAYSGYLPVKSG